MPDAAAQRWSTWYRDHGPALLLFARQITSCSADAEDLVQEAFTRTWRHLGEGALEDPKSLLFLNLRRAAVDHGRSVRSRRERETRWASDPSQTGGSLFEPVFPFVADERRRELEGHLASLPPEAREVLVLKIWGDLTFEEIGRTLEIPTQTAASRYRAALERLHRRLTAVESRPAHAHLSQPLPAAILRHHP